MRRRDFIAGLGATAAWMVAAKAQQPGRLPTIGYLGATTAAAEKLRTDAFMQRLHELNWIVGRRLAVEYRWAESRAERFADLAGELVRLRPDVLVATTTAAALACKQATTVIPIVFSLTGDPLRTGLVTRLAHPGGNITGLSNQAADLGAKRVEILRELIPGMRRLAILANADYPGRISEMADIEMAARKHSIDVTTYEIHRPEDFLSIFDRDLRRWRCVHEQPTCTA